MIKMHNISWDGVRLQDVSAVDITLDNVTIS